MNKTVLFVFEGKNTEPEILSNLKKYFLKESDNVIVEAIFDAELFQFLKLIKEDSFLDLVGLLKERGKWNSVLDGYDSSEDFTSIYLFFDHDAHSHLNDIDINDYHNSLNEGLKIFDNETEIGKLYISYPMVEALRDTLVEPQECSSDCCTYISLNTQYKYNVNTSCKKQDFKKWNQNDWYECIAENLIRCFMLHTQDFTGLRSLTYDMICTCIKQDMLLRNQWEFYLKKNGRIVVISAFALFLQEYYGKTLFDALNLKERLDKYCSYFCLNF